TKASGQTSCPERPRVTWRYCQKSLNVGTALPVAPLKTAYRAPPRSRRPSHGESSNLFGLREPGRELGLQIPRKWTGELGLSIEDHGGHARPGDRRQHAIEAPLLRFDEVEQCASGIPQAREKIDLRAIGSGVGEAALRVGLEQADDPGVVQLPRLVDSEPAPRERQAHLAHVRDEPAALGDGAPPVEPEEPKAEVERGEQHRNGCRTPPLSWRRLAPATMASGAA